MASFVGSRVMPFADHLDHAIRMVCQALIYLTTTILLVALTLNVLFRYILPGGGINWLSELPEHLFPWMIAGGVVLAAQHNAHIAVDFVLEALGERSGRIMMVAIQLLLLATYVVFTVVAWNVSQIVAIEFSSLLRISRSYAYYALVFLGVGLCLTSLSMALRVGLQGLGALPVADPEDSVI